MHKDQTTTSLILVGSKTIIHCQTFGKWGLTICLGSLRYLSKIKLQRFSRNGGRDFLKRKIQNSRHRSQ